MSCGQPDNLMSEVHNELNSSWDPSVHDANGEVPLAHASLYGSSGASDFLDPSLSGEEDGGMRLQIPGLWGGQPVVTPDRVHTAPAVSASSAPYEDFGSMLEKSSAEFMPATAALWQSDDVTSRSGETINMSTFAFSCQAPPISDPRMAMDGSSSDFASSHNRPNGPEVRPVSDIEGLGLDQCYARPSGPESRPVSDAAAAGLDSGTWWREMNSARDPHGFEPEFPLAPISSSPTSLMCSGEDDEFYDEKRRNTDDEFEDHEHGCTAVTFSRTISRGPDLGASIHGGESQSSGKVLFTSLAQASNGQVSECGVNDFQAESAPSVKTACNVALSRALQEPWRDTGYHICGPRCRRCCNDPTAMSPSRVRLPPVGKSTRPGGSPPAPVQKRIVLNKAFADSDTIVSSVHSTPTVRSLVHVGSASTPRRPLGEHGQQRTLGGPALSSGSSGEPAKLKGLPCEPILGRDRSWHAPAPCGVDQQGVDRELDSDSFWPSEIRVDRGASEHMLPKSSSRRPLRGCRNPRRTRLLKMAMQSGDLAKTWGNHPYSKGAHMSHRQESVEPRQTVGPVPGDLQTGGSEELLPPVARIRGQRRPMKLQSLLTAAWDVKS